MATIKERADKYSASTPYSDKYPSWEGYVKGANDQRAIDIEKACEWWTEYLDYPTHTQEDRDRISDMVSQFRKAMNNE